MLINDSDPNPNDSISVTGVNGTALLTGDVFAAGTSTVVGTVTVDVTGNYTFSPDALFTGEAEFTYTITDENGNTDTATVSIEVRNTDGPGPEQLNNTPPIATNDRFSLFSGIANFMSNLFGNDSDPDGDVITATEIEIGSGTLTGDVVDSAGAVVGTATITDPATGAFTVVMTDLTYIGEVFFDYTITDPSGDTDSATVTLDLVPDTNGPANDPPVAENDTVTGTKNSPVSGSLLTNDTDPNAGDTSNLTVTDINGTAIATNGTTSISLSDGTLVYDADTNTLPETETLVSVVFISSCASGGLSK